jgi:hypothetical protein
VRPLQPVAAPAVQVQPTACQTWQHCPAQLDSRDALLPNRLMLRCACRTGEYAYAAMRVAGEDAVSQDVSMDEQRSLQLYGILP